MIYPFYTHYLRGNTDVLSQILGEGERELLLIRQAAKGRAAPGEMARKLVVVSSDWCSLGVTR